MATNRSRNATARETAALATGRPNASLARRATPFAPLTVISSNQGGTPRRSDSQALLKGTGGVRLRSLPPADVGVPIETTAMLPS